MKILTWTLILLPALFLASRAQEVLSLEQAVSIGLERNHRIRIARNDAEIARSETRRGTAGFLPTLDATGNLSFTSSQQETNSPFSFGDSDTRNASAQLALNWTLFDGFRMFAEHDRLQQLARLGASQARNVIEQTVMSILGSYIQVVRQSQLLSVQESTLALSRTRFEKALVRHELGGSLSELLQARIAYHADSATALEQKLQVAIARRNLNLAVGRDPQTPFLTEETINLPDFAYGMDEMLAMARKRNAELDVARSSLEAAEAGTSLSHSAFYPRLSLFATYGYADRLVDAPARGEITTLSADASVGLSLSFNLFDGFRNLADVERASLAEQNARLTLEEADLRLEGLLDEQSDTYRTRLQALDIEEIKRDAAQANLQLQIERFDTGTISSLEFRDAQLQYIRAETSAINARFAARIALLELQRLIGELPI